MRSGSARALLRTSGSCLLPTLSWELFGDWERNRLGSLDALMYAEPICWKNMLDCVESLTEMVVVVVVVVVIKRRGRRFGCDKLLCRVKMTRDGGGGLEVAWWWFGGDLEVGVLFRLFAGDS